MRRKRDRALLADKHKLVGLIFDLGEEDLYDAACYLDEYNREKVRNAFAKESQARPDGFITINVPSDDDPALTARRVLEALRCQGGYRAVH